MTNRRFLTAAALSAVPALGLSVSAFAAETAFGTPQPKYLESYEGIVPDEYPRRIPRQFRFFGRRPSVLRHVRAGLHR